MSQILESPAGQKWSSYAYTTRLRLQTDYCGYDKKGWPAVIKKEMIHDKFVFGLKDDNLKERLFHEADISVALIQRIEFSQWHIKEMSDTKSIDTVHNLRSMWAYGSDAPFITNIITLHMCFCHSRN